MWASRSAAHVAHLMEDTLHGALRGTPGSWRSPNAVRMPIAWDLHQPLQASAASWALTAAYLAASAAS